MTSSDRLGFEAAARKRTADGSFTRSEIMGIAGNFGCPDWLLAKAADNYLSIRRLAGEVKYCPTVHAWQEVSK
jgi:hypothetical protein